MPDVSILLVYCAYCLKSTTSFYFAFISLRSAMKAGMCIMIVYCAHCLDYNVVFFW